MENKLAENIRRHRKDLGFTQEQLAERLGITLGTISKWERGSSAPDLGYLMDLAELFHVSVDALIGFSMRGTDAETEADRIEEMNGQASAEEIAAEYEGALKKFPNHFRIVAGAASVHKQFGSVNKKEAALKRALELYRRALDLISQNRDPNISEVKIRNEIAGCYSELKDYRRAVDEFKKNNICGNNNASIGLMLIKYEEKPKEGIEYTLRAYFDQISVFNNTVNGLIHYYAKKADFPRAVRAAEWFIRYLESLKEDPDRPAFPDKIICLYHLVIAVLLDADGRAADAEKELSIAVRTAKTFDRDPVFTMENILFAESIGSKGTFYDTSGPTALAGLRQTLVEIAYILSDSFREKCEKIFAM